MDHFGYTKRTGDRGRDRSHPTEGSADHRVIALLLLEEVTELPSFMKIAEILRDSYDLDKWDRSSLRVLKESAATRPQIPGVPQFRGADPKYT